MKYTGKISVIIPTLNEEANIDRLLSRLKDNSGDVEIIVVDGGSEDKTIEIAQAHHVKTLRTKPSRAIQMNLGAQISDSKLLYFVHADTLPPESWKQTILKSMELGVEAGCFRFEFDENKGIRKVNSFCTRFPFMMFRGGDQSLYITKKLFEKIGGFDENLALMEDYDIIKKLKKHSGFSILKPPIIVSSRKYVKNNYLKVNLVNFLIFASFYLGADTHQLKRLYSRLLNYP